MPFSEIACFCLNSASVTDRKTCDRAATYIARETATKEKKATHRNTISHSQRDYQAALAEEKDVER